MLVNEIKHSGVLGRRRPKVVPFYFQVQNYNLLISMLSFNESMIHFQRQFIMAKTRLCNYITKRNINQQMEGLWSESHIAWVPKRAWILPHPPRMCLCTRRCVYQIHTLRTFKLIICQSCFYVCSQTGYIRALRIVFPEHGEKVECLSIRKITKQWLLNYNKPDRQSGACILQFNESFETEI